ncbi:MAG: TolB family protein [Armatimonadota bacterium]
MLKRNLILLPSILLVMFSIICGCSREYRTVASFDLTERAKPAYILNGDAIVMRTDKGLEVIREDGQKKVFPIPDESDYVLYHKIISNGNHILYGIMINHKGKFKSDDPEKYPDYMSYKSTKLYELDIISGKTSLLREFPDEVNDAEYSPDGSILAIVNVDHIKQSQNIAHTNIWLYDQSKWRKVDTGEGKRILDSVKLSTSSTDGKGIYALKFDYMPEDGKDYTSSLMRISLEGNTEVFRSNPKRNIYRSGVILGHGEQIIYSRENIYKKALRGNKRELALVDTHTGDEKPLSKDTCEYRITPDSTDSSQTCLAASYARYNSHDRMDVDVGVHFINLKTKKITKTISVKKKWSDDVHFIQWHPRSQKALVVYTFRDKREVREYDISKL